MLTRLEISGVHTKVNPELQKYITKKIGHLDRYMPKHARESAHIEVLIKLSKVKERRHYTCEVIMKLPKEKVTIKETTVNPFAAVDIVEAKTRNHLKKYKETHSSLKLHRRVIARLRRKV